MASSSESAFYEIFGTIHDDVSFTAIAPKIFTKSDYDEFRPYNSPDFSDSNLNRWINQFIHELGREEPSDNFPFLILTLAQSLKSVNRPHSERLFKEITGMDDLPAEVATYLATDVTPRAPRPTRARDASTINDIDRLFYPYFAAYLLKLLVKSESNVRWGLKNMRLRFTSFYSKNYPAIRAIRDDWMRAVKALIISDPKISVSWVKTFVPFEQKSEVDSKDLGMVRFLAILPLSYTGMHAYKLFGDVKLASKLTNKYIIHSLIHPLTEPGLKQITMILNEYEKQIPTAARPAKSYDPSFKYARLLSPQYFMELQTKSCPALVCVLNELLHKYKRYDNTNQDPISIKGINSLPETIRSQLKYKANLVYEAAKKPTNTEMSSSPEFQEISETVDLRDVGYFLNVDDIFEARPSRTEEEELVAKVTVIPEEQEQESEGETEEVIEESSQTSKLEERNKLFPKRNNPPQIRSKFASAPKSFPTIEHLFKHADNLAKSSGLILLKEWKNTLVRTFHEFGNSMTEREVYMFFQGVLHERNTSPITSLEETLTHLSQEVNRLMGIVRASHEIQKSVVEEISTIKEEARQGRVDLLSAIEKLIETKISDSISINTRVDSSPDRDDVSLKPEKNLSKGKNVIGESSDKIAVPKTDPRDICWASVVTFMQNTGFTDKDINQEMMPVIASKHLIQDELDQLNGPKIDPKCLAKFGQWFRERAEYEYSRM